jgi:hypothetical protein
MSDKRAIEAVQPVDPDTRFCQAPSGMFAKNAVGGRRDAY